MPTTGATKLLPLSPSPTVSSKETTHSLIKNNNIQLWILQRDYYMAVGNTERVSFYNAKLKEVEDADDSIPDSIPPIPPTPGAATAATSGKTTATTSTEDDEDEEFVNSNRHCSQPN
jgi:hypothetical protein